MGYKWKSKPAVINPDGTATVPLTRGFAAMIDAVDAENVSQFRWHVGWCKSTSGIKIVFAKRSFRDGGRIKNQSLHHFLTGWPRVDHKDGNELNNRRNNLRPATQQQNCGNRCKVKKQTSSAFRGVSWNKQLSKWRAIITHFGRQIFLGNFKTEQAAADAYAQKEIELRGEFAGSRRAA